MKAILKFDLSDPDDCMEHKRCIAASNMAFALWEMMANGKRKIEHEIESGKWTDDKGHINPYDVLDGVFGHFNDLLEQNNVNINGLVQ